MLPSTYNSIIEDELNIVSKWEYVKVGVTKTATVLMSSGAEANSFTRVPELFENELLYTYILALYQRLELKKLIKEFKENNNIITLSEKLIDFMRRLWIKEITRDEFGSKLYRKWRDTLGIGYLYQELKKLANFLIENNLYKQVESEKRLRKELEELKSQKNVSLTPISDLDKDETVAAIETKNKKKVKIFTKNFYYAILSVWHFFVLF